MEEENVALQEEQPSAETVVDQMLTDVADDSPKEMKEPEEKKVPLSALQKERRKRQELELQIEWERQQRQQQVAPPEEDTSKYESATKEDLGRVQQEAVRIIEEKMWVRNNPEKYEKVNEYLSEFLKQRPNLASAINSATNRYEEAYTLMEALTPRQQQQLRPAAPPKKETPGAPTSIPKAAALNQAVDVMTMSDTEFLQWRNTQKRRK